jgi:uncharacterized protein
MSAADVLDRLTAYRITEIPRRPDAEPAQAPGRQRDDPGRTQRAAALAAAYHAGAGAGDHGAGALAFGWVRHHDGGSVQFLAAGAGLVGSGGDDVFLTLPGGARAQPLPEGAVAALMSELPGWRAVGGISDGLLPEADRRAGEHQAPSLEECLLATWPGPFGWLLLAEPLSATEIAAVADELAHRELRSAGNSDRFPDRAMATRRLHLRHAEILKGRSTGLWRVRLLAGGSDNDTASRVAGLVCASADLSGLPYAIAPAERAAGSLGELLADPGPAPAGGDGVLGYPFLAGTDLLAALARPPEREVPGMRLVLHPDFDVTQEPAAMPAIAVGDVLDGNRRPAGPLMLPLDSLNRHVFVCGATGAGKSQTVRGLLEAATRAAIPWLVVEPAKAEYRLMAARLGSAGAAVVRIRPGESDAIAAGLNPLEPAPDGAGGRFPLQTHADLIKALFIASFRSEEPFPQVLSAALTRVYQDAGWDLALGETIAADPNPSYPTLTDLQRAAERIVQEIGYSQRITDDVLGFIKVRLSSLRLGTTGRFLEGGHQLDFGKLLAANVVLEIEDVGDDGDKAFLMGTVLIRLAEHLRMANRARPHGPVTLRHLTVIEEAHRLLRRHQAADGGAPGGAAAHAVEMFAGLLAEIRAYGEGLIIAEQIPERLVADVIKNTAVKITHRLPAADDRDAVGATMNMTAAQNRFLVTLKPGHAAVFADGMDYPLLVRMPDGTGRETAAHAPTATPAGVVQPRSRTCGADCAARPCTLRDMRVAQRALDEYPGIRLWTELSVLAHLTGWPMPVPRMTLLSLIAMMPSRLRDCALSHGVDAAVSVRVPVIAGRVSPAGLASHVSAAIRSRVSRGAWLCQREEPSWLAPAYQWTLVLDALKSEDRKNPGAGPHPRSPEWERTYGHPVTGDTCARQVGTAQRWYDGAQRDAWEVRSVAFGVDHPSAVERAVGAVADDDDFEERLTGYLDQFVDCRWPRLYLTPGGPGQLSTAQSTDMCMKLPTAVCILGHCRRGYPQRAPVEKRCSGQRQQLGQLARGRHRPGAPPPAAGNAQPDQRQGGRQPDARRQPRAVELADVVQPMRFGGALDGLRVDGRPRQQADQDQPVQAGRRIQRQQAEGHHVVPRSLEGREEEPGEAQRQGRGHGRQAGYPVGHAQQREQRDGTEQQVCDQREMRRHARHAELRVPEDRPPEQLVHGVPRDPGAAGEEDLDRGRSRGQVGGDHHHRESGRRGRQGLDGPAAGPRDGRAEQDILHLGARRDAGEQPGKRRGADADPPVARAQRGDAKQPEHRGEPVDVAARDDLPEQQRVHRPEQMGPQAHGRVAGEEPVQGRDHRAEGQRLLQLEPEGDAGERGPAELGRDPLRPGGHGAVYRYRGRPGGRDLGERYLPAYRVAAPLQLQRRHDVRAVPGHGRPPAGRVGNGVRRAGRREDGEDRHGQEREGHDRAGPRARATVDGYQAGDHPRAAQRHRDPQRDGHERGRQVKRVVPPRRAAPGRQRRHGDVRSRRR